MLNPVRFLVSAPFVSLFPLMSRFTVLVLFRVSSIGSIYVGLTVVIVRPLLVSSMTFSVRPVTGSRFVRVVVARLRFCPHSRQLKSPLGLMSLRILALVTCVCTPLTLRRAQFPLTSLVLAQVLSRAARVVGVSVTVLSSRVSRSAPLCVVHCAPLLATRCSSLRRWLLSRILRRSRP